MFCHNLSWWRRWCELLWDRAEAGWIDRQGQDHLYRRRVVVPALQVAAAHMTFDSIIDIGSGDGSMTSAFVRTLPPAKRRHVVCLDHSSKQLWIARRNLSDLTQVSCVHGDVCSDIFWSQAKGGVNRASQSRLWISVFMLQELPSLKILLKNMAQCMAPGEQFLAITTSPSFVDFMICDAWRRYGVRREAFGCWPQDFTYAMEYPVPVADGTCITLPHFQRWPKHFRRQADAAGLVMKGWRDLTVPWTLETERVFGSTIYGRDILERASSVLMTFERPSPAE